MPNRLWVPALVNLALAVAFGVTLLVRTGGDVSVLVHAAPPWTDPARTRPSLTVQPAEDGFDGQFFYRLGVSPWSSEQTVAGVTHDLPALRNARWGYGALAWLASGGDADLVPWSLVALNLVATATLGAVGGAIARRSGRHAAWGLLFGLWPGFAYSLSMDTSELMASTLALAGLLALRMRRWPVATALMAAAVITRDTAVVIPLGVAAGGLATSLGLASATGGESDQRRAGMAPLITGGATVVVFGAWQLIQRSRFGVLPLTSSGDNNLSAPFAGFIDAISAAVPPDGSEDAFRLVCMVGLVALLGAAAVAWRATQAADSATDRTGELLAWCGATAVVVMLNAYLWSGATAFMRATTEAGVLSILAVLGTKGRLGHRLATAVGVGLAGLWLLTAGAQVAKLG